jgi:Domain of unknown function (DUF4290)
MEYNSQRTKLMIPEYGRYIQNLARKAAEIKDRDERNAAANAIVELLSQTNPQFRNIEEYRHKLWDHLIIISDFRLDVDSPYPNPGRKDVVVKTSKPLPYPKHNIKFRHYGRNLETVIAKSTEMDEEKRKGMSQVVANYMKLVYANWNKESISDDAIREDLSMMSDGRLQLPKDATIELTVSTKQPSQNQNRKQFNNKFQRKNRNFNNKFKRKKF